MIPGSTQRPSALRVAPALAAIALALTALNCLKPLHIDDTFILRVAEQMAEHPGDPYGFEIFWLQWPQPVSEELTPPVLPYWWSAAVRLFGQQPVLWKLWLLPFALLLTGSLFALFRRFARGVELPLTALTVLSPAFLPGFNLMQDVPAQALGLGGLALFLRASDRNNLLQAILGGLAVGLATQTKYSAVAVLVAMAVHGLLARRVRLAAAAVGAALAIFLGWEAFMVRAYGQSMFLGQVRFGQFWYPRHLMLEPLLQLTGGLLPAAGLVAAAGLRPRRGVIAVLSAGLVVLFGLLFRFSFEAWLFHVLGLAVLVVLALTLWRLFSRPNDGDAAALRFLALWLLIEVGVYFVASPFPAARRVLGIVVVVTLLAARWAAQQGARKSDLVLASMAGITLGLVVQFADIRDATAQRDAVDRASRIIAEADDAPTVWFVGHWGFQYYAERAGMRPVVPDRSRLAAGDWIVVPEGVHRQEIVLSAADAEAFERVRVEDRWPISTGHGYYGGMQAEAGGAAILRHLGGPRMVVSILRVRRDVIPETAWSTALIADFALHAGGETAAAALPALLGRLASAAAEERRLSAQGLAGLGLRAEPAVPALAAALTDRDPGVRYAVAEALGRIGRPARPAEARLEAALDDPDPAVRRAVREALELVRGS